MGLLLRQGFYGIIQRIIISEEEKILYITVCDDTLEELNEGYAPRGEYSV